MTRRPKVVVYDYGSGNVRSAERALVRAGADVSVTADQVDAVRADGLVVPGVGAFGACMDGIEEVGGRAVIGDRVERERPVLGICVGMQVLFSRGVERGIETEGLGEWPGVVEELRSPIVPHMGWNTVDAAAGTALFDGIEDERFYFVHSYAACVGAPDYVEIDEVTGWTEHGARFAAVVERGPLMATQFHPEKSGDTGARLLANWVATL